MKDWLRSGSPWIWLSASAVSVSVVIVVGLLALISWRGITHFWPDPVVEMRYAEPGGEVVRLVGTLQGEESVPLTRLAASGVELDIEDEFVGRQLLKVGNRELNGLDFRWVLTPQILERSTPDAYMVLERREWGDFYGRLEAVLENGQPVATGAQA